MKQYLQPLGWGLAMASVVALASNFALAVVVATAQAATVHQHRQHAQPTVASDALPGERWATDEALREGMTRVHEAVQRSLPSDPGQPFDEQSAAALQREIEAATAYLIANCRLPEAADAGLHGLLSDLLEGAESLSDAGQREPGLQRIFAALERYTQLFAEPVWRDGFLAHPH